MKLTAKFDTRREAEMTVERLVQQFEIDRDKVVIATDGTDNTAGVAEDGSDAKAGDPSPEARHDAELNGKIVVTVEVADDTVAGEVREAFAEFDASEQGGEVTTPDTATQARQREIATEHLLFKLMEYVEDRHSGLLDFMENSLDHLGDPATDETKDDEAVRGIARKMIVGARKQGVN